MKRNSSAIIVGGILVILGLIIVGKAFGMFNFSLDGWWTLFIIVPCLLGLVKGDGSRIGCLIGLGLGVLLLCWKRKVIEGDMFAPSLLAIALVAIGLGLILGDSRKNKIKKQPRKNVGFVQQPNGNFYGNNMPNGAGQPYSNNQTNYTYNPQTNTYDTSEVHFTSDNANGGGNGASGGDSAFGGNGAPGGNAAFGSNDGNGGNGGNGASGGNAGGGNAGNFSRGSTHNNEYGKCVCTAILSGRDIRYDGEVFNGGMLSAVLGGIDLDLRTAIVSGVVTLEVHSVLGGIDIFAPRYARVIVNGAPVLGSIENATRFPQGANDQTPTIIINASCVLGGVEVK